VTSWRPGGGPPRWRGSSTRPGSGRRARSPQLLVRALAFRIATLHLLDAWDTDQAARHRPVVDAVVQCVAGTLEAS
jgi:hypothetical protein